MTNLFLSKDVNIDDMRKLSIKSYVEKKSITISVCLILLFSFSISTVDLFQRRNFLDHTSETILEESLTSFLNEMDQHINILQLLHETWIDTNHEEHLYNYDRYLKTLKYFYKELGIKKRRDLERALKQKKISKLPGFGEKRKTSAFRAVLTKNMFVAKKTLVLDPRHTRIP